MVRIEKGRLALVCLVSLVLCGIAQNALADGNEILNPPVGLTIATGTGVASGGVGLADTGAGTLTVNVPLGATVKQVIVYWNPLSLQHLGATETITINGVIYTGGRIGGEENINDFGCCLYSNTYRLDLTGFNLVAPGITNLAITNTRANGAGIYVIYTQGSEVPKAPMIVDGQDYAYKCAAYSNVPPPSHAVIVAKTFTFPALTTPQIGHLNLSFGSVQGPISTGGTPRPNIIDIFVNGVLELHVVNQLGSHDGNEWDTFKTDVSLPIGSTSITIAPKSEDDSDAHPCPNDPLFTGVIGSKPAPASLIWLAGFVNLTPAGRLRTVTQGGWGAPPHGNNPGSFLVANFSSIGPVVVGCSTGYKLTFNSAAAIEAFLPQGGTPGVLKVSATNPTTSAAGVFAGQVLALQISTSFSNAGKLPTGLGGYVLTTGPATGKTVATVLADANKALGGCGLPSYVSNISDLNFVVDQINNLFDF